MVVWQSKYDRVVHKLRVAEAVAAQLARELVIVKNSYERVFATMQKNNDQFAASGFTQEELKAMRRMMHPDRNGGSETATQITQKLNGMIK